MQRDAYLDILSKLVAFNTVSSAAEGVDRPNVELIAYAQARLAECGFRVQLQELSATKQNLYAVYGAGPGGVLLAGHADTVPFRRADWSSDPLALRVSGECAWGLGACDMKGFLALMLTLASQAEHLGLTKRLGILITADEETSMLGARDFARRCRDHYDLIVIGEPTRLEPLVAHKGYICAELAITGTSCHSSNPALGLNAIDVAYEAMGALKGLQARLRQYGDQRFAVPYPTLNMGAIHGGDCANRLCDELRLLFDVRPLGEMGVTRVNGLLAELVEQLNCRYPGRVSLRKVYEDIACFSNGDQQFIGRVERELERTAVCESYCTEAGFLQQLGNVVVYGPGSIAHAHRADEHIDLQEVELGSARLLRLIEAFARS